MTSSRAPIAAVTMVYNERVFLPMWLKYYGGACGVENLYVFDHGSTDRSTDDHAATGYNRMRLPRTAFDDLARAQLVQRFVNGLLEFYETVIYADADELIVPDPDAFPSLSAYAEQMQGPCAFPIGINVVHIQSAELPLDPGRPILGQRRFGRFSLNYCKPLVVRKAIGWSPGFHRSNFRPDLDPRLVLFHLKRMDAPLCYARQQLIDEQVVWSERAIEQNWGHKQRSGAKLLETEFARDEEAFLAGPAAEWNFAEVVDAIREYPFPKVSSRGFYSWPRVKQPEALLRIPERFYGLV